MDKNDKKDKIVSPNMASFAKGIMEDFKSSKSYSGYGTDSTLIQGLIGNLQYGSSNNKPLLERIKEAKTVEELRKLSEEGKKHQGYADVINFFKNMYYYRYIVTPVKTAKSKSESSEIDDNELDEILSASEEMLRVVDDISFEAILPNILEIGLFEGAVALYLDKVASTVKTYVLPIKYCQPFLSSSYGTTTVMFDLDYFDAILDEIGGSNNTDIVDGAPKDYVTELKKTVLGYYPKELVSAYLEYKGFNEQLKPVSSKKKGPQKIHLDQNKSAFIPFSPSYAPPKIKTAAAEGRYDESVEIAAKKNKSGLDKILTHRIPFHGEDLVISYQEAQAVQKSISSSLKGDANIKVLTTIGETDLYDIQKDVEKKSSIVQDSMNNLYDISGINPELFRANTDYALKISMGRASSFMWDILQKIITFYNLSINQQFKFGNYACSITLLPITIYDEEEKVNAYRRSAEYGIGKLEAIVATGQKQVSLHDKLKLEAAMKLDTLLTPLQSSHTRSSKDQEAKVEITEVVKGKKDTEEKEIDTEEVNNED